MYEILTNPVFVSVAALCALCLLRLNVLIVLFLAAVVAGLTAGLPISETMATFVGGMGGNAETATSYVLLGAIAVGISRTGLTDIMANKMQKAFAERKFLFLLSLGLIAVICTTIIPVNIAFIPIVVPPLLLIMNRMKMDRRAAAVALGWGLKAPYMFLPITYGMILHKLIANNMTKNGTPFEAMEVWKAMIVPAGVGMTAAMLFAIFFVYNKPREYKDIELPGVNAASHTDGNSGLTMPQIGAILGALSTFVIQLLTDSLVLGGVVGLLLMLVFRCFKYEEFDDILNSGVAMIGWIAFVMMASSGFSEVVVATDGVGQLIQAAAGALAGSKIIASSVMILIGLLIVMGTGTAFGTVPILAVIYTPLCASLGYTPLATACLIGVASCIGDVCSPASDGTLGPTAGLDADGQHDHVMDSALPEFLVFMPVIFVLGAAMSVIL